MLAIKNEELELRKEYWKYYTTLVCISEVCVNISKGNIDIYTFFEKVKELIDNANSLFFVSLYTDSQILKKRLKVSFENIQIETNRLYSILSRIYSIVSIDYKCWPVSDLYENIDMIRLQLRDAF